MGSAIMRTFIAFLTFVAAAAGATDVAVDHGYELIFQSNTTEVDNVCFDTPTLPSWLSGSYIMAAIGQMEINGQRFNDVLDAFGKLNRFQMNNGTVCFTTKMMNTGFYNESMRENKIGRGVLFDEPTPPRDRCFDPMCNVFAPNDNVVVNSVKLGGEFMMVTDSPTALNFDPFSLEMTGKHKWSDHIVKFGNMGELGSGHPLRIPGGDGRLVDLVVEAPFIGK